MQNFNKNCIVYIVLVFISLCLGLNTYADGSRDLYPSGVSGGRASLRSSTDVNANAYPFPTTGTHYVYAKSGETLTLASSAQSGTNARIKLFGPNGTELALTIGNNAGNISNRTAELEGPRLPGQTSPANAYTPIYHTVTQEGIYRVEFLAHGNGTGSGGRENISGNGNWTQATNAVYIPAWDISVANAAKTNWIKGRVYMNVLNMDIYTIGNGFSNIGGFYGKFKILTKDGYVYNVDNNGNNGISFTFFVNNKGFFKSATDNTPLYKSMDLSSLSGRVHDPRTADSGSEVTHKIFYTLPANDLPNSANGAVPGGNTWLRNNRIVPKVEQLKVIGVDGTNGQVSNKGGKISFETGNTGQYKIVIESNGGTSFPARTLTGIALAGVNNILWDGKDGAGNPLPQGNVPAKISVQLQGAEVHFPYLDMEINPNGIILELLSDDLSSVESNIVYWDDTDIPNTSSGTNSSPKNASHFVLPNGTPSSGSNANGHKWGANTTATSGTFGDIKAMDTWTFILGPVETLQTQIAVKVADLKIESISTSNGVVKVGDEIVYNVVVKNDGPSDVEGAPFSFNAPTGYEVVSATPKTVCAGGGEISPSITSNKFNSALNMPNGCSITYEIKVKPTSTAPFGPITVDATIMRPNDVTDPDATNPDINTPPTDPYFECGNGVAGAGCNNIKNNTTVTLIDLLTATKSIVGNPVTLKPGQAITYQIKIKNSNTVAKTPVQVSDVIPAGLSQISAITNGGTYNPANRTITWSNLSIAGNSELTLSFNAVVDANLAAGTTAIKNTAIVTDPIDPTVPVTPEVEVPTEGKITSVKSIVGNPTSVKSGDELEYRIVLTNSYGTAKTGVTVSDALAAELNAPTAISNGGSLSGNTINWTNLTVPANGTLTLSFKAVVKANLAAGTVSIKNTAIVTDPIDPTVPVTPEVEVPTEGKITSVKSIVGNPTKVKSGDELEYRIVLTNSYGTAKTGVTVSDALAAELNTPTAISNGGSLSGNTINWTNLTVPANGTLTLSFKAVVKANLAAGTVSIKNTAIVTDPIDPTVPVTPEVEVPTEGKITSVKSIVGNPTKVKSGDELEYRIVLTNSYGTVKTGVTVSDDLAAELNAPTAISNGGSLSGNTINWTNLTVPANGTLTLSFKAVVKANLPTGTTAIKNTAIVTDPIDPTVPVTPEVEVPTEGKITSVKSIVGNPTSVKSGDELEYRIVLTNSYGTAKTGVTVSDALAAELNAPTAISNGGSLSGNTINWTNLTVPANGTLTLSFKAVVKANLAAGTVSIKNTAIVTDPIDPTVPVTPEVEVPTEGKITSVKSIVGNPTKVKSGDELEYRIVLTNSYGTAKTGVTVSDALAAELNAPTAISNGGSLSGNTINWTNLTVPANGTLTLSFKAVVKANLAAGTVSIKNTAIVTDPIDPTVPVTPEVEVPTEGKITSVKSIVGNPTSVKSGDELEYRIVLTNSYGTAKTGVTVSDALAAELNAPTAISNGGSLSGNTINWTNLTVPANGTLTLSFKAVVKANLAAGTVSIKNTAIVTDPIDPTVPVTPEVEVPTEGKITSVKSIVGNPTKVKSGDELEYRIVLTNSYGTAKTGVTVSDALAAELNAPTAISNGGSLSGNTINWTNLTVPANGTLTLSFKAVVKANLAAGTVSIKNTAIVTDPIDPTVPVTPEVEVPTEGKITSVKSIVGNPTKVKSGDELEYRIVLTNSYGTAKTGVTVSDALAAELNAPTAISNNGQLTGNTINWTNLTVPANGTLTLSFKAVVKANLAAGTVSIKNTAIVTDPIDPTVPVTPEVEVPTEGKITSVKSIVGNPTSVKSGDELEYRIVLTNSYGTAKTGVTVSDALAAELNAPTAISNGGSLSGNTINWTNLTVPANGTLTLSFKAVVKANLPTGTTAIKNTAIVTDPIDPTVPVTPEVEVKVPSIALVKESVLNDENGDQTVQKGETITYTFKVFNNGGTIVNNLVVNDTKLNIVNLTVIPSLLNPGETGTATASYTLTQADIDAGNVTNTALAKGTDPRGRDVTDISGTAVDNNTPTVTVLPKQPSLILHKTGTYVDKDNNGSTNVGDVIKYHFEVINNGNVTVKEIRINDPKVTVTGGPVDLAPGSSDATTFSAEYVIKQEDIDRGGVYNLATAEGKDPDGDKVTVTSKDPNPISTDPGVDPGCLTCTITPLDRKGEITVMKTANLSQQFRYAGEKIEYDIVVSNTGNVTLKDVKVTDANADNKNIGTIAELKVGQSETFKAYHTITAADMLQGYVSNIAVAVGNDPKNNPVTGESKSGNPTQPKDPVDPNCKTCTITPLPWKEIKANNDTPPAINGKDGGSTTSVLDNDQLNGQPVVPAEVKLTPGTSPNKGITMNPDGTITVSPETPGGIYEYPYTICELLNPANCSDAKATVVVEAAPIKANNDTPPAINGKDGGSTTSVLDNDQLNGQPVVPAEVKLTPGTSPNTGITMNPNGTITVSPETPAGIYEYPYTICELLNPANCSDAKATVVVEAAPIKANNDTPPAINGKDGGSTTSVLDNDQLNGKPVVPAEVKLTPGTSPNKGITMNPDGTVTVSPETPAGIYEYPYTICELLNPANCSDAKVTVVVEAAVIKANNDTPPAINGKDGGSTTSVLDNDQLNGKPVVPAEVKLTPDTSPNTGITMNPDGTVTVSPETPAGIYEYPYTICELLNPANCSDAKVTVVVEAAVIKANNDTPPAINGKDGGSTTSVLDNDQLNGKPVVPAEVKLTPGTSPNKGITMNPDGTVTVSPETPAGIYEYPYTICELLNPANCSDAKVTVVVEAAVIKANNDTPPAINGKDGGSTTSVLDNDQLNGKPVVPAEVKLTPGTSPNKGITMNPDGTVTISPETPAGVYEYPYTICELLNPANCSDAKVTVVVEAAPIKANSDTPVPVNGKNGKTIPSVLDNDQLNGKPVVPAEVKLTPGTSPNKGITMNPDGTITVSPETPAGNYEYPYTICEVLNPANCSNTVVRITVVEPKLEIVKVADRSRVKVAGEEITYTITVKNTGGVEFNNLVLTDVMFPAWNEKIAVLAVGATRSFSLTHKVTQDEIENGVLVNIAKVNAQDPDGKPYQPEAKIETPVDNLAGVTVVKTGDRKEVKERGDKIVYTITVENTGNKILYSVEVTDPLTKLSKTINQLTPGQKEVFTTEYVVIQSDFDLAEIENTAFVKAKDGKGNAVDASGQYNVTVSPLPLHIPNVFTPNGDGQNDKFEIEGIERFDRVEMTIINRWGNEVYRNSRYDNNWVGEGLNEGTYYYIIETHKGSTKQLHKGWVLIKRN